LIARRVLGVKLIFGKLDLCANCADPACVSIDNPATDRNSSGQPKLYASLLRECAGKLARREVLPVLDRLSVWLQHKTKV
jgi:hypothetical protein